MPLTTVTSSIHAGVGICMAYACFFICLYFNVVLAYALIYMAHSLENPLPWSTCDPKWADENCFVRDKEASCRVVMHHFLNL